MDYTDGSDVTLPGLICPQKNIPTRSDVRPVLVSITLPGAKQL